MLDQLTFLLEARPASRFRSRESAEVSTTAEVGLCSTLSDWRTKQAQDTLLGKTFRAVCHQEKGKTSRLFYLACVESMFPSQQKDGRIAELSSMPPDATGSPGECLTLSLPECPDSSLPSRSAGDVCGLSAILETGDVPQKYYLSEKACLGILRRASERGKKLPEALRVALERQAGLK